MNPKPHYIILDGFRGVAALMVVLYHLFEAVPFAAGDPEQNMFHGFLAVDFFFILSGFVMGYAYDDRWNAMSVCGFFKRRLIRMHSMAVLGVIVGFAVFVIQGCRDWNGNTIPWSQILLCTILSLPLVPSPSSMEVRDNTELFPLTVWFAAHEKLSHGFLHKTVTFLSDLLYQQYAVRSTLSGHISLNRMVQQQFQSFLGCRAVNPACNNLDKYNRCCYVFQTI